MIRPSWLRRKVHYYLYSGCAYVPQRESARPCVDAASLLFSRTAYSLGKKSVVGSRLEGGGDVLRGRQRSRV